MEDTVDRKCVVLLDMDGTITPAREKITNEMINCLTGLARRVEVGIVSGSDIDYVMEQCGKQFMSAGIASRITLLPCNGTKVYKYQWGENRYQEVYSVEMRDELGNDNFETLVSGICRAQSKLINRNDYSFPLSGHFVSERGSTLNWSIIGRTASKEQRKRFCEQADRDKIRELAMSMLVDELYLAGIEEDIDLIEMTLGGQTSIDIYPRGWDKTYALKHYPGYKAWFVGDRCFNNGNDKSIYDLLKKDNRAFNTTGPKETMEVLDKILSDILLESRMEVKSFELREPLITPPPVKRAKEPKKTVVVSPGDTIVFVDVFELSGPEDDWFKRGKALEEKPKNKSFWQKLIEFLKSES